MKYIDISNKRYGRLLTIKSVPRPENIKSKGTFWECLCDCGKTIIVNKCNLEDKKFKPNRSCGCYRKEVQNTIKVTHGMRHTTEYRIWIGVKTRCYNDNNHGYHHYGKRGIIMSDDWKNDFNAFYRDMGPRPSLSHSIERRDNNGNYTKFNCYWATPQQQALNRRNNVFYWYKGVAKTLQGWSVDFNIPYSVLHKRITQHGWTNERAFTTPVLTR